MKSIVALCLLVLSISTIAAASGKIQPWVLEHTKDGQYAEFLVVLKDRVDLSGAASLTRKMDRGRYVFALLLDTAGRSQAPLRQLFNARGVTYQSFYIVNALLVRGDRALAEELALRPDVLRIVGNPEIRIDLPQWESGEHVPSGVEWNIDRTRAPEMWDFGFTGQGIVIGGADTGYRWTHNALKSQYRGWNGTSADHDYNWHDSIHSGGGVCGADSAEPCDDYGHGTHTMGTAVGDDGGANQIGMAPGAKWIGCRNMNEGNGTPATYLECFEFFLAPYPVGGVPANGDPDRAPDLTTNSWTCPPSEGCSALTLEDAVDAQKAAGIMTVVAAGNSGSSCSTVDDPPSIYDASYTIGATNNSDSMASFSSRGSAASTNLTKPDIVAPGVSVRSATRSSDTAYSSSSGTSMATPNVAGGVALLWSAVPALKNDQDQTEAALNAAALRLTTIVEACGGDYVNGPNNTWGYGRMDVAAAYDAACNTDAPTNLSSSINGSNDVELAWDTVTGATSYQVHRGEGACPTSEAPDVVLLGTTAAAIYTDTTASPGASYHYFVRALGGGCFSVLSDCADVLPCLFCDDFEDGDLAVDWDYAKPNWVEAGGVLQGDPGGKKAIAIASPAFSGCANCTVQTAITVTGGIGGRAWLLAWYVSKSEHVELLLKEESDAWVLKQRSGGVIAAKAKATRAIVPGTEYEVSVAFNGAAFHVEVDGSTLLDLNAAAPVPAGTVGFQCKNTTASFAEIVVN